MRSAQKEAPAGAFAGASPSKPCGAGQALTGSSIVPEPNTVRCATGPDVLANLADALGVQRGEAGGWHCPSPDHDDEHASAGIFLATQLSPEHGRYRCQACGRGGDAIDLVRTVLGLDFNAAMTWLASWLAERTPSRPPAQRRSLSVDRIHRAMCECGWAEDLVQAWLNEHKGLDVDPAWLVREFDLGATRNGSLLLPYRAGGSEGIVGASRRWKQAGVWRKADLRGSRHRSLGALYGEHRDRGSAWTVLVEGESDCLAVAHWLRSRGRDVTVFGIPGASVPPTVERLRRGRVVLLLDADPAGEGARARWREALTEGGATVYDARLPEGCDAIDAGRKAVIRAISRAVSG